MLNALDGFLKGHLKSHDTEAKKYTDALMSEKKVNDDCYRITFENQCYQLTYGDKVSTI